MPWPADHPVSTDPGLSPWAGGIDEVAPGARVVEVLRYLPGRRVATLVEHGRELAVVKVFASPRARGNVRRLHALAGSRAAALVPGSRAAALVPGVLGCDAAGHVLAVTYRHGVLPGSVPDADYAAHFVPIGAGLRRLHDSGSELDRLWEWEQEVTQLRRGAVPATTDLVETLVSSTRWLGGAALVPAHRDFHPRQVVLGADRSVAFIDLDDAAMAPRGLDIGNMLGHLVRERATGARPVAATTAASEAFLEGYGACAGIDEGLVTAWTMLTVARLAGLAESRHGDTDQRDTLLGHARAALHPHGAPPAGATMLRG